MLGNLVAGHADRVVELWRQYPDAVGDLGASPDLKLIISVALSRTCGANCREIAVSDAHGL